MKTQNLVVATLVTISFSINFAFADPYLVQSISFNRIDDKKTTNSDFQLYAISDSLLDVTYSREENLDGNVCDVTPQGLVHIIKEGTCTIYANQNGNETYLKADQVSRSFTISLPGPNQVPIVLDMKFGSTPENNRFVGTFSGADLDDNLLTFSVTKPLHGTISDITFKSNSESTFVYTPDKNFHGRDTFTYKANDGKVDSDVVSGSIEVTYVPQPPEINLIGSNSLKINIGDSYVEPGVTAFDEDGNDLLPELIIVWDVDTNKIGEYTKTYSVTTIAGLTNSVTRTIKVVLKNTPPKIELTYPLNNSTISGTVQLTASSTDDNDVPSVKFYVDGLATSSSLNTNYLTNATHIISSVASDLENLYATSSVSVIVNNVIAVPAISAAISGGSGGGGGGGSYVMPLQSSTTTQTILGGISAIVATTTKPTGKVLGASVFNFKKNLTYGANNNDVLELQKRLSSLKFLKVKANGNFGPATKRALAEWQKKNGLPSTGYFGPMSRVLMNK